MFAMTGLAYQIFSIGVQFYEIETNRNPCLFIDHLLLEQYKFNQTFITHNYYCDLKFSSD